MTFLETSIFSDKIKFYPAKNNSPVIILDHCNVILNLRIQLLNTCSKLPEPETQKYLFAPGSNYNELICKFLE
jgi:hypothetical protein